jgi:hypothetical protein
MARGDSMSEQAFSCMVSTVGLVLPFILVDPPLDDGVAISNAQSVTACVWITQEGIRRPLVLSNTGSAIFTYTVSMGDTRTPKSERGYLEVTIGQAVFPTSHFVFLVTPHF